MKVGLSVIVPCLNEAASIPELVGRLDAVLSASPPLLGSFGEAVLVDDGSRDDTWRTIDDLRGSTAWLKAIRHDRTRGIPTAWRTGLGEASGDTICVLDADLQYDPGEIPRLCAALTSSGADIVQGSRSRQDRALDARLVLSRGLSALLNGVFGMRLRDNKSGFFICRRDVLADLLSYRGHYRHWQCFVMVAAHCRGYNIHQVDTPFRPRVRGRSAFGSVPLMATAEVTLDLWQAIREYGRRR